MNQLDLVIFATQIDTFSGFFHTVFQRVLIDNIDTFSIFQFVSIPR